MKKGVLLFLFLISSLYSMGQGFVYSYDDPCTSKTNEIYIDNPNGSTALFYGGQTQTFTGAQLQSGAVQQWINQVNSSNPLGPCSGVGLAQNVTVNATIATNNIAVLTSVLSTLSSITSMAATVTTSTVSSIGGSTIGGIVQADEKVTDNNNNSNENKDKSNNNTNGTTTTNNNGGNSTTTNGNTGTSQVGGNQNTSSGVGGGANSQGGETTTTNNTTSTGSQSSQSSVTSTQQVPTNNPSSNPVASGNQVGGQTTNNQGNNSVSSNSPVTSGNNSTSNTNNPTTPNTNNSTTPNTNNSTVNNQNSPTQPQNNQNSPVVSENNNSQGQTVSEGGSSSGGGNLSGGANAVKADTNEKNEKQEQAKEDAQTASAQNSSGTKSKVAAVKQGSVMMTGDIVTISSADGADPTQVKINASIIMSNTKNTFAKGALINFTSTVNNSNVTLFMSFRKKKLTTIFANSTMMNFEKDLFNTTSIMESYQYHKITGTVGLNLTTGNIGDSKFQSISTLAGLIGTFKVNKNFGMTTMFVMVYSPYVFFYEGMWNQSGYIAVPFVAVDYKLTKKFKLNVSFSGVNQINDKTLNYQVLLGAKAFL